MDRNKTSTYLFKSVFFLFFISISCIGTFYWSLQNNDIIENKTIQYILTNYKYGRILSEFENVSESSSEKVHFDILKNDEVNENINNVSNDTNMNYLKDTFIEEINDLNNNYEEDDLKDHETIKDINIEKGIDKDKKYDLGIKTDVKNDMDILENKIDDIYKHDYTKELDDLNTCVQVQKDLNINVLEIKEDIKKLEGDLMRFKQNREDEKIVKEDIKDEKDIKEDVEDEQIINDDLKDEKLINDDLKDEKLIKEGVKDEKDINEDDKDGNIVQEDVKDQKDIKEDIQNDSNSEKYINDLGDDIKVHEDIKMDDTYTNTYITDTDDFSQESELDTGDNEGNVVVNLKDKVIYFFKTDTNDFFKKCRSVVSKYEENIEVRENITEGNETIGRVNKDMEHMNENKNGGTLNNLKNKVISNINNISTKFFKKGLQNDTQSSENRNENVNKYMENEKTDIKKNNLNGDYENESNRKSLNTNFYLNTIKKRVKKISCEIRNINTNKENEASCSYDYELEEIKSSEEDISCLSNYTIQVDKKIGKYLEHEIKSKHVFNWQIGQYEVYRILCSADEYSINGIKYKDWKLTRIPTIGLSKRGRSNVHEMFETIIRSNDGYENHVKLFIKKIPIKIWMNQFDLMNEYNGEYIFNGENFIMEACALAFLNEYHVGIVPKLYKILFEIDNMNTKDTILKDKDFKDLRTFNHILKEQIKHNIKGYVVIISEFFGEDLYSYLIRRNDIYASLLSKNEKKKILSQCLNLMKNLHDAGLAHLDFIDSNILISNYLQVRLCDFSKSSPIYTYNLRHTKEGDDLYFFQSCVSNVSKIPYTPPECFILYKFYKEYEIDDPLKHINYITDSERKKKFYYEVTSADKYMLGILFIKIWNNEFLWEKADILKDKRFSDFMSLNMNFDKFEHTKKWPNDLKNILQKLLHFEYRNNLNLNELNDYKWWS
ncbi:serine/threonine protein kinase, FIKK family, putative [Plasmodium sp. gorilla clade G2]|uniref:serine/threonine protein kinase, FIKK family, putative n=1 Tax=Plasmodium sp. gorilla clade G2 TaxID=880535 RepID=UPI000D20312F|nr:serine/threonine protein kinase, FIKK family, putative [Plasmodium sp. gorilla clade G2]SOV13898.1 serine/threonine protein kinase, FIKK family, putative [Plasmodium sp. gorilla clade G2]